MYTGSLEVMDSESSESLVCQLLELSDHIGLDPLFMECIRYLKAETLSSDTFYDLENKLSNCVIRDGQNFNQVLEVVQWSFASNYETLSADSRFASVGFGTLMSILGTSTAYPARILFRWNRLRDKNPSDIESVKTRLIGHNADGACSGFLSSSVAPKDSVYRLVSSSDAVTLEVTEYSRITVSLEGVRHNRVGFSCGLFEVRQSECRGIYEFQLLSMPRDSPKAYTSGSSDEVIFDVHFYRTEVRVVVGETTLLKSPQALGSFDMRLTHHHKNEETRIAVIDYYTMT